MNEAAANALIEAAMNGTRQIKDRLTDDEGGYCAMGVLEEAGLTGLRGAWRDSGLERAVSECPECGATEYTSAGYRYQIRTESGLIVHLNNDHGWSFLDIARKLGPSGDAA